MRESGSQSVLKHKVWDYEFSYDIESRKLDVKGYHKEKPKTLFKYYALSENSVDALTKAYIYASHPYLLNDPFDCDKNLVEFNTLEDVKVLFDGLYDQFKETLGSDEALMQFASEAFHTIFYRKCGILSLTENKMDPLMWPLYTNNEGFCVEFDYSKFPFEYHGPFHIIYKNKDGIKPLQTSESGVQIAALYQCLVKHKEWERENEWRLLVSNPQGQDMITFGKNASLYNNSFDHNRKFKYPLSAIVSVTLGCHFLRPEAETLVTKNPTEIECFVHSELKRSVLRFLSSTSVPVKLAIKDGLCGLKPLNVRIVQLSEQLFRIIEVLPQ